MSQRKKLSPRRSQRIFSGTAARTNSINLQRQPHRGGWRM